MFGTEQGKTENKEEDDENDIADEEHGVEMSEDFEGKTHDVEKSGESENENSESEDEENNDLEEQMGDVVGPSETLDEKLWADSDGEDDSDNKVMNFSCHFIIQISWKCDVQTCHVPSLTFKVITTNSQNLTIFILEMKANYIIHFPLMVYGCFISGFVFFTFQP